MSTIAPPPLQTSLVDASGLDTPTPAFYMTSIWYQWLLKSLIARAQNAAQILTTLSLTGQHASISTTAFPVASLSAGLYRIQYYAAITTVGTTSSSLTVTFGWTDGGVSKAVAGAAITANLITTVQTNTFLIHVDGGSPINYSTTYASNAASEMNYRLDLVLEGPLAVA